MSGQFYSYKKEREKSIYAQIKGDLQLFVTML